MRTREIVERFVNLTRAHRSVPARGPATPAVPSVRHADLLHARICVYLRSYSWPGVLKYATLPLPSDRLNGKDPSFAVVENNLATSKFAWSRAEVHQPSRHFGLPTRTQRYTARSVDV
jgi:hypothetical protein